MLRTVVLLILAMKGGMSRNEVLHPSFQQCQKMTDHYFKRA